LARLAGAVGQQRRHEAGARADLEHGLVALHLQLLQQTRLELRREHVLALGQRHLGVHERQRAVGGGHEVLALDGGEQLEHGRIQHLPGPDLLFDHVEAGLFDVHGGLGRLGLRQTKDKCGTTLHSREAVMRRTWAFASRRARGPCAAG
jgi:hypothetical protein